MEVWNVPFSADPGQPQKSLDLVVRMSVQCQKYGAGQGRRQASLWRRQDAASGLRAIWRSAGTWARGRANGRARRG